MDSRGTIPCLPRVSDAYDGVENVGVGVGVAVVVVVVVVVAVVVGVGVAVKMYLTPAPPQGRVWVANQVPRRYHDDTTS